MVFTVTYDPLPNIRLVKAVEKYPVLYNTVSHYPNRKAVDEAWEKVASEVNDTNVCCKERWLNLRNSYKRYLRQKLTNSVKKPYYLAGHMDFLEPHIVLSGPRCEKTKKEGDASDTETSLPPYSPDNDDDDENDMTIDYLEQSSSGGELMPNEGCSSSSSSGGKSILKTSNTMAQTSVTYGVRQANTAEENFSKNPDLAFFISIMPDIRSMSEEQKEKFRKEVVNAIDNILYAEDLMEF